MKNKLILITLILSAFSFFSCKELNEETQFFLDLSTAITIPNTTEVSVPFTLSVNQDSDEINQILSDNDTHYDLIDDLTLVNTQLIVTSPSAADFAIFENITISINAPGLDSVAIAWNDSAPSGTSLHLNTSDEDLSDYFLADNYTISVTATLNDILPEDYTLTITNTLAVDAQLLSI